MKTREVITAFLRHSGKILLLRRSERVGSYQGRWGAVSGSLEETTPLQQAWREIQEETALAPPQLHLSRSGRPLEVKDQGLGICWLVHPFLFEVTTPEAITLDWEHTELRWITPAEMTAYKTVPDLAKALAACLEEAEDSEE